MPPQHTDLLSDLQSNNVYFDSLVNMIPANLYVAGASGDDKYHPKYKAGQHKESKEARRARNKIAKGQKFDPEKMETTLETKRRVKKEMEEESDSDDAGDDIIMSDGDGEDENDAGDADQPQKKDDSDKSSGGTNESSYASRIEMLRAKLHAKMAEKRAAAGITSDAPTDNPAAEIDTSAPALVSKRAARRAEKRKRQEAAKQRNKKRATSVAEHKQRDQQRVVNLGGSTFNAPNGKSASADKTSAAQDLATIDYQSLAGLKPKLDGALDNKSLGGKKKKSLEHLLADAERKQARLKELTEHGTEDDKEKAKNAAWGEAMKTAEGTKVRKTNDPKLLRKALKKKVKKKTASAKAWNVRLDQAKEAATKRQNIRSHNLDQRKLGGSDGANLSSKRIKEVDGVGEDGKKEKRKRQGPHANREGFEGKKSGFINGGEGSSSAAGGGKGKQ